MELPAVIDLFADVEPADRLELLIDFGTGLSALPAEFAEMRDKGLCIVHECQAPVFFYVGLADARLHIEVDVPVEAAIARGFATLLKGAFNDRRVFLRSELPGDLLKALQIDTLLGLQRRKGLSAIYKTLFDRLPLSHD